MFLWHDKLFFPISIFGTSHCHFNYFQLKKFSVDSILSGRPLWHWEKGVGEAIEMTTTESQNKAVTL